MSDRRIRVLHVVLNLHQGGLERIIGELACRVDPARFSQQVLALEFLGQLSSGLEDHVTLHVADDLPPWSLALPSGLSRQVGRLRPHVVHSHSGVWFKATRAARMAHVPLIVHTDHGRQSPDPWVNRWLDGLASRQTDIVIAVSDALRDQLQASVVRGRSQLRVIRNGVDTDRFRPRARNMALLEALRLRPDQPVIGTVGRLDVVKDFDVMIRAFALLRQRSPAMDPVLVMVGDGPQRVHLHALVEHLGLADRVHLLGWRSDVESLHTIFNVFTLSSRSEGTSIALLEAMSAGLCPVVTNVGGNAAVLGPQLQHRLCVRGDAESLMSAWRHAFGDPSLREHDGRVARERVNAAFSVKSMVEQYERLYEEGVGRARRH